MPGAGSRTKRPVGFPSWLFHPHAAAFGATPRHMTVLRKEGGPSCTQASEPQSHAAFRTGIACETRCCLGGTLTPKIACRTALSLPSAPRTTLACTCTSPRTCNRMATLSIHVNMCASLSQNLRNHQELPGRQRSQRSQIAVSQDPESQHHPGPAASRAEVSSCMMVYMLWYAW